MLGDVGRHHGEMNYLAGRVLYDVAHGRFERSLSGLTAMAAVVTTAEIYFEHYKASFGNKWMWSPTVVTPPVVVAGVGGVFLRDYNHWATIGVLNELLPQPDNRVILADETDPYGIPVARFDYTLCDNDKANLAYSTNVIGDVLHAAGAQDVLTIQRFAHLIGGARMGTGPDNSVVDADHRVWGVPNLLLTDGSVCAAQGSANPALTIMALASRLAISKIGAGPVRRPSKAATRG